MILELTREQRQTIDAHRGQAVYVFDPDHGETFVLLPSSDFDKVRAMLGYPLDDGPWTDEKNRRRVELIDRKIAGTITAEQLAELAGLQRDAERIGIP